MFGYKRNPFRRSMDPLRRFVKKAVLFSFALAFGSSECFDAVSGVFEFLPCQQFGDGEDLQAGVAAREVF